MPYNLLPLPPSSTWHSSASQSTLFSPRFFFSSPILAFFRLTIYLLILRGLTLFRLTIYFSILSFLDSLFSPFHQSFLFLLFLLLSLPPGFTLPHNLTFSTSSHPGISPPHNLHPHFVFLGPFSPFFQLLFCCSLPFSPLLSNTHTHLTLSSFLCSSFFVLSSVHYPLIICFSSDLHILQSLTYFFPLFAYSHSLDPLLLLSPFCSLFITLF